MTGETVVAVLSLFPGIGLLDRSFEDAGFCVVRGPDRLWGGDVHRFHPPPGVFAGVIGGPPCQAHSPLRRLVEAVYGPEKVAEDLIPEFLRCVGEAKPPWWVMENAKTSPPPELPGYQVHSLILNNRWLGAVQNRERRISFGTRDGRRLVVDVALFESLAYSHAVTSQHRLVPVKLGGSGKPKRTYTATGKRHGPSNGPRMPVSEMLELQGFPPDLLDDSPFTVEGQRLMVGNGVPRPMGLAIANAVKRAMGYEMEGAA